MAISQCPPLSMTNSRTPYLNAPPEHDKELQNPLPQCSPWARQRTNTRTPYLSIPSEHDKEQIPEPHTSMLPLSTTKNKYQNPVPQCSPWERQRTNTRTPYLNAPPEHDKEQIPEPRTSASPLNMTKNSRTPYLSIPSEHDKELQNPVPQHPLWTWQRTPEPRTSASPLNMTKNSRTPYLSIPSEHDKELQNPVPQHPLWTWQRTPEPRTSASPLNMTKNSRTPYLSIPSERQRTNTRTPYLSIPSEHGRQCIDAPQVLLQLGDELLLVVHGAHGLAVLGLELRQAACNTTRRSKYTQSCVITHCVRKEGEVLFNDKLNTFYLHMVKDHSAREETCCCHMGYSFCLAARVYFYMHHQTNRISHITAIVTSCGALAGIKNSSMGPSWRNNLTTHHTMIKHLPLSYISLHKWSGTAKNIFLNRKCLQMSCLHSWYVHFFIIS